MRSFRSCFRADRVVPRSGVRLPATTLSCPSAVDFPFPAAVGLLFHSGYPRLVESGPTPFKIINTEADVGQLAKNVDRTLRKSEVCICDLIRCDA